MGLRVLVLVGVLLFFVAEVSTIDAEAEKMVSKSNVVRGNNRRLMEEIDCDGLCTARCSLHSRPNRCTRACETCCVRCKCVPPGTSGNREKCGTCYTDMTTHGDLNSRAQMLVYGGMAFTASAILLVVLLISIQDSKHLCL